jgi:hypothetical protein
MGTKNGRQMKEKQSKFIEFLKTCLTSILVLIGFLFFAFVYHSYSLFSPDNANAEPQTYTKISVKDTSTPSCKRAVERIQFDSDVSNEKAKALVENLILKYGNYCWYTVFAHLPGQDTGGAALVVGENKAGEVKVRVQNFVRSFIKK